MPQPPISIHSFFTFGRCFARQIDLEARLGVAEIVRAETGLRVLAEQRGENVIEQRLQVAHRDVLVDVEAFELVEIRRVRGVGGVAAVNAARRDDADRRRALEHRADLHGRRVRAQEIFFVRDVFLETLPKRAVSGK